MYGVYYGVACGEKAGSGVWWSVVFSWRWCLSQLALAVGWLVGGLWAVVAGRQRRPSTVHCRSSSCGLVTVR